MNSVSFPTMRLETVSLSDHYRHVKRFPAIEQDAGGMFQTIDNQLVKSVSSDRSMLNIPILKTSRWFRFIVGVNLFFRQNWHIIRPILIALGVAFAVMVIMPILI